MQIDLQYMYFEHQLIGAYEHVGSTEVDHEFTIDGIRPHVRLMHVAEIIMITSVCYLLALYSRQE